VPRPGVPAQAVARGQSGGVGVGEGREVSTGEVGTDWPWTSTVPTAEWWRSSDAAELMRGQIAIAVHFT